MLRTATQANAQIRFPDSWLGHWSGRLTTYSPPDSVRNTIPITLDIAREPSGGACEWTTIFNADTVRGLRPYRLIVEDAARRDGASAAVLRLRYVGIEVWAARLTGMRSGLRR